jgi:hypothetical protein
MSAASLPTPQESMVTICDPDGRPHPVERSACARLLPVGCTGWLIDDCHQCLLTAGHCAAGDMQVAEFNVPLSLANGSVQHPPPQHQYVRRSRQPADRSGAGVGNDWTYFGLFANATTGLTAGQAQGSTYVLSAPPAFDRHAPAARDGLRLGLDAAAATTSVRADGRRRVDVRERNQLSYRADTTGGNSGSPVIHEPTGVAIGIHTHGGCSSTGGANNGTASTHPGCSSR